MDDIAGEIRVEVGEGSAHIIIPVAARSHKALEIRDNPVVGSPAGPVDPETVVHFLPSVQRKHDVIALPVRPLRHLIVKSDSVRGQRKPEILVVLLLDGSGVRHRLFADVEIHQRLAPEEVHLQITAASGMLNQKVDGPPGRLEGHKALISVKCSLRREAVGAVQVAGVCDEKTERLDHRILTAEVAGRLLITVRRKQLSRGSQFFDVAEGIPDILLRCLRVHAAQLFDRLRLILSRVDEMDRVIGKPVRDMHAGAVDVKDDVVSVHLILVNHAFLLKKGCRNAFSPFRHI